MRTPAGAVADFFSLFDAPAFAPRYNIAPTQLAPVIRLVERTGAEGEPQEEPSRELVWLHWGLVPHWADDASIGNRLINARSETVSSKPAFRAAFRRRRCLVVADGFYEWQQGRSRGKRPYFIHFADDRPFAFAGLWESWEGADHSHVDHARVESCTILTTEPNDLMRPIHDRMPVILSPETHTRWLDRSITTVEALADLLAPFPAEDMIADRVSTYVNKPQNDDARCIEVERDLFS